MTTPPECLRCGLCCFSPSETYVRVTGGDWSRLGPDAERLTHWVGHRAYMRRHENHCAALELRRTADGAPQYFCIIYDRARKPAATSPAAPPTAKPNSPPKLPRLLRCRAGSPDPAAQDPNLTLLPQASEGRARPPGGPAGLPPHRTVYPLATPG